MIYNIIGKHPPPRWAAKKPRPVPITGVTVHQTGCRMPDDPNDWGKLNAHYGITRRGEIVMVNDPADFIWHAQALSTFTIGIEVEGNFYGIEGRSSTLWKGGGPACEFTEVMAGALQGCIRLAYVEVTGKGGVYGHCQSHRMRVNDPGQSIWRVCHGVNVYFGTVACESKHWGTGCPIPKEWK